MTETKASKAATKKEEEAKELAEARTFAAFYVRIDKCDLPSHGAVGVHGYLCNTVTAKKGYGLGGYKTLPGGYSKTAEGVQTNVLSITDIRLSRTGPQNDVALYLMGIAAYLRYLTTLEDVEKLLSIRFIAPYNQLKNLFDSGLDYLESHNFKNKQGIEVPYKLEVAAVCMLKRHFQEKGIEVRADLDSDEKSPGLQIAQSNAAMGLTRSIKCNAPFNPEDDIDTVAPERYWNYSSTRHPFFNKSRQVVVTNNENFGPNAKVHYLIDFEQVSKKKDEHHKREIEVGQRLPSSALSVAIMDAYDPVLAAIYTEHEKYTPRGEQRMGIVFLSEAYTPDVHRMVERTGGDYLRPQGRVLNLLSPVGKPVTHELFPPRQAFRLLGDMHELEMILRGTVEFVKDKDGKLDTSSTFEVAGYGTVSVRDVTQVFYDQVTDDKGKVTYKLAKRADIPNTKVLLETPYPSLKKPGTYQEVDASIGIDTPVRNAMSAMADEGTRVYLTTAIVSEKLIAYQTVFVYKGDAAIYSGHYCRYVYSLPT